MGFRLTKLLVVLLIVFNHAHAATKDCTTCTKDITGKPGDSSSIKTIVALADKPIIVKPKRSNFTEQEVQLKMYCNSFSLAQDTVDVENIFEKMEASKYADRIVDMWSTPLCDTSLNTKELVPIIYNSVVNPIRGELFPKAVHDYFVEDKKNPEGWLKAINSLSTDGMTLLDFIEYNVHDNFYSSASTREPIKKIINYLCKNGGVYSKYKDANKCQM